MNIYMLDTDYTNYFLFYECHEFPRDNPFMYEQHSYVASRDPGNTETQNAEYMEKVFRIFASFGIDTEPFVAHDQGDCGVMRISWY